jgi:hypothetical protein
MVLKFHKKNKITLTTRGKSLFTNKVFNLRLKEKDKLQFKRKHSSLKEKV